MSNNLWGQIDQEQLVARTLDEAIAVYVSHVYEEAGPDVCLPEIVRLAEYESMTVSRARLNPLEMLLEDLDGEYSVFDWVESTKPDQRDGDRRRGVSGCGSVRIPRPCV